MARQPEYEVKKVRQVSWVHPKTQDWLAKLAKKHKCSTGKILDKIKAGEL